MSLVVQDARAILRRAAAEDSAVLVALSGGKDSLVTLDLCCQYFERVETFFMYLVDGLRCCETPIQAALKRSQVKVHHSVPHWDLARILKYGVLRPHINGADKLKETSQADVEKSLRAKTGIRWVAWGMRATDSSLRRMFLTASQGYDEKCGHVYPIWKWKTGDVFGYLKARRIPVPGTFGSNGKSRTSGFGLDIETLTFVKRNYPDDWPKIKAAFPFCDVLLKRQEFAAH